MVLYFGINIPVGSQSPIALVIICRTGSDPYLIRQEMPVAHHSNDAQAVPPVLVKVRIQQDRILLIPVHYGQGHRCRSFHRASELHRQLASPEAYAYLVTGFISDPAATEMVCRVFLILSILFKAPQDRVTVCMLQAHRLFVGVHRKRSGQELTAVQRILLSYLIKEIRHQLRYEPVPVVSGMEHVLRHFRYVKLRGNIGIVDHLTRSGGDRRHKTDNS